MATEVMERTKADEIRELARRENELFQAWLEDSDEPSPGVEYWRAFDAWQYAYERRALPIAADEMERLAQKHTEWNASAADEPDRGFWIARQHASEACLKEPPAIEQPKSVAELVAEKVSIRQIAKIWKLILPDGEPDIAAVEKELAEPGSVITPEHIAKVERMQLAALGFEADPAWTDQPAEPDPPATEPTSLDRLIADRANVEQIARIKAEQYGTDICGWLKAIPALAELMGVKLAQNASQVVNEGGQSVSEKIYGEEFVRRGQNVAPKIDPTEITLKSDDDEEPAEELPTASVDDRIVELFEGGQDITAIAREVSLPVKKVRGVIRKWEHGMKEQAAD